MGAGFIPRLSTSFFVAFLFDYKLSPSFFPLFINNLLMNRKVNNFVQISSCKMDEKCVETFL